MKLELDDYHRDVSDDDLIEDVRVVANKTGRRTVTLNEYNEFGKYHSCTLQRRFRSWFRVLELAGLEDSRSRINLSEEELFENLRSVWVHFGRQPKYVELVTPISRYSNSTYGKRFGTWRKALEKFVEWVNDPEAEETEKGSDTAPVKNGGRAAPDRPIRRTRRDISERLRFSILLRDGFRCQSCGQSPVKNPGVELHIDHVLPWEKGGETVSENLQTKCSRCNLGKGNAFDK